MPAQVAIVHGWSDTSESFHNLRGFLVRNGYDTAQVWLGDYVSKDDDVRVEDVAKRMELVLRESISAKRLTEPFDLIVHSTGGLVAREWVARFYANGKDFDGNPCPAKRIIMLAPANFGSALASLGKSMIGRVAKGWNNWFQTGTEMLGGLELASPYQWNLARRDLVDPVGNGPGPYEGDNIWPFVIIGTRGYSSGLRRAVSENGSDGTVRPAAANMNVVGLTVDFAQDHANPSVTGWQWRNGANRIPFAVLPDRDHSTIVDPAGVDGIDPAEAGKLGDFILEALSCQTEAEYQGIYRRWKDLTEATAELASNNRRRGATFLRDPPSTEAFHQYMQVFVYVRDDHGQPVNDYFVEFFAPGGDKNADEEAEIYFQKTVLEDIHVNSQMPSMRCFYADRTDLMGGYYPLVPAGRPKQLAVSISAANIGANIRYFDQTKVGAAGELVVHDEDDEKREALGPMRLHRNATHLVEIVIPRQPTNKVFKLSQ